MFEMLIGLPAAGKTTYAKTLEEDGWTRVSSDDVRRELYGSGGFSKQEQAEVFKKVHALIMEALDEGKDVVYDATNMQRKFRIELLNKIHPEIHKAATLFVLPIDMLKLRNKNRENAVPEEVYDRMIRIFDPPYRIEGFQSLRVINAVGDIDLFPYDDWNVLNALSHNCPYHMETIGKHLNDTEMIIRAVHPDNYALALAARYHDIGKPFVKTEEPVSHFYNHEQVSSYIWLLTWLKYYEGIDTETALRIATMINYHMRPFVWTQSVKALIKDLSLIGDDMYHDLLELHLADQIAAKKKEEE